jgi:hypothetical protein
MQIEILALRHQLAVLQASGERVQVWEALTACSLMLSPTAMRAPAPKDLCPNCGRIIRQVR